MSYKKDFLKTVRILGYGLLTLTGIGRGGGWSLRNEPVSLTEWGIALGKKPPTQ